jgi:D-psicose/D-tagatose/L-ribulose 3-epimerase
MAKLGLHTFAAAPKWDIAAMEELLPKLQKHSVRALEIPLLDPSEIDIAATRAFCDRTGIEPVCSLGLPPEIVVAVDPDAGLAFLEPALKVANAIGAFALAGVTYGTIGRTSGSPRTQREFDATVRFIKNAAERAKSYQLKLGIEPCNRYETHIMNTGADGRAYCEAVGADNVFIHIDTYHMNIEEASFSQGFRDCGPFLGYVHLSESNRGTPGAGTIAWAEVYHTLAEIGFDGITTLESMNHVHPAIASDLAIWRPVAANADDVIETGLPFLLKTAKEAGFHYD